MRISINVSEDNEGTESPWWAIVDPRQNMSMDLCTAAHQITGPFFSRKEAEDFLGLTRYNFSKRAKVWCFSGYYSSQYKWACRKAKWGWPKRIKEALMATLSLLLLAVQASACGVVVDGGAHHHLPAILAAMSGLNLFLLAVLANIDRIYKYFKTRRNK